MKSYLFKLTPEIDKAKLKKQLDYVGKQTSKTAKNFSKALTKSFSTLKNFTKSGFIAGVVAKILNPLQEINDTINNTLDRFDNIGRLSDQLGADPKEVQALSVALQSKGLDQAQIEKILNELQTEIGKARRGDETAKISGISETETAISLFGKIMDIIGKTEDVNQAKSIATSVFGEKEASRLFDALRSGEEFAAIFKKAYELSDANLIRQQQTLQGYKDQQTAIMELQVANERAQKINQQTINLQLEENRKREALLTSKIDMQEISSKTSQKLDEVKDGIQKAGNFIGEKIDQVIGYIKEGRQESAKGLIENNPHLKTGGK